jgi:hypothetical protein
VPVHDMTKAASSIIGQSVPYGPSDAGSFCGECGYGAMSSGAGVFLVHAAGCPKVSRARAAASPFLPDGAVCYVACDNRDCRKVLDPVRVASNGAKTCDDRCRAAAWKQRTGYGRNTDPAETRSHGYTGSICDGCGGDVSQSGDVHSEDCPVFSAQLARAIAVADATTPRRRRKPSGAQVAWGKAVAAVSAYLQAVGYDAEDAEAEAVRALRPALSERQRKQLEDRESERGSA